MHADVFKKMGGQAFPIPGNEFHSAEDGMTLLDHFAGQATTALMINQTNRDPHWVADQAYRLARAMLEKRNEIIADHEDAQQKNRKHYRFAAEVNKALGGYDYKEDRLKLPPDFEAMIDNALRDQESPDFVAARVRRMPGFEHPEFEGQ